MSRQLKPCRAEGGSWVTSQGSALRKNKLQINSHRIRVGIESIFISFLFVQLGQGPRKS